MATTQADVGSSSRLGRWQSLIPFVSPYRWQIAAALTALLFTSAVTLSIGQGLRLLIDSGFAEGKAEAFDQAIGFFLILALLLAVGTFTRFFLVSWIGERVVADIRRAVFDHIVELHPAYFETTTAAEVQSRITTDTSLLQTVIGSSVSIALRNFLMFIGGLIWMFISNAKLTMIVILVVPVVVFPILFFGRRVRALSRTSQDKIADVGSYVTEVLQNLKVVQAFNHQELDKQAFTRHVDAAFDVAVKRITQRSWMSTVVIVLVLGALAAMVWVGGHDVMNGVISAGELAAFMFYAVMVASSVAMISEVFGELQRAAGATERLMELYQADNLIVAPDQCQTLQQHGPGALSIQNVDFSYPSRPDELALQGINLTLEPGKTVALVGSSGAGKSTLFDLLLRFYDPKAGEIILDGVPLLALAPQDLRAHIGLVPQQPVLFAGTIADNIRYGFNDASDEQVEQAAKAAFAHEFILQLPQGYASEVGERGVRLSGGQRQRIAIARAILKDPEILLLDEATSALDAESEYQVQKALEQIMQKRTSLVIAHRLATVINADVIVVLDKGQIVAQGKHSELLEQSELYARWAKLQFDDTEAAKVLTSHS